MEHTPRNRGRRTRGWNGPLAERFWRRVKKTATCWLWTGEVSGDGYGRLDRCDGRRGAHRVAYELSHGPIAAGLSILHRCDNRRCVRPGHLFAGTQRDNMVDAAAKCRIPFSRGEANMNARLTEESVREIRRTVAAGATQQDVAKEFGVSFQTVSDVVRRTSWKHVA